MVEKTEQPVPAVKVSVVLKKEHRHGGKNYAAGTTIQVCEDDKRWLERHKVI